MLCCLGCGGCGFGEDEMGYDWEDEGVNLVVGVGLGGVCIGC